MVEMVVQATELHMAVFLCDIYFFIDHTNSTSSGCTTSSQVVSRDQHRLCSWNSYHNVNDAHELTDTSFTEMSCSEVIYCYLDNLGQCRQGHYVSSLHGKRLASDQ